MKPVKQYVLIVDGWRGVIQSRNVFVKKDEPLYKRNTAGRYRVAAKTEKEAIELLRDKIGFGSIQVFFEDKNPKPDYILPYKKVMKEDYINKRLVEPKHAVSPLENDEDLDKDIEI